MSKNVLVVAAHPDDEILGCGATICKHTKQGDVVHIIIMAEGLTSRDDKRDVNIHKNDLVYLHTISQKVADLMGVRKLILGGFPDNRMDSVNLLDVVKVVEKEMQEFEPDIVYTHHFGDVNIDHRIVHDAVITACRSYPGQTVKTLLFFEILSSTEWQMQCGAKVFCPTWFEEVSKDDFKRKEEALHLYSGEMRNFPHSRSYETVLHLAQYRGSSIGVQYAEAYELGRYVNISPPPPHTHTTPNRDVNL